MYFVMFRRVSPCFGVFRRVSPYFAMFRCVSPSFGCLHGPADDRFLKFLYDTSVESSVRYHRKYKNGRIKVDLGYIIFIYLHALELAHVCACVTGLQHSALYRFGRFDGLGFSLRAAGVHLTIYTGRIHSSLCNSLWIFSCDFSRVVPRVGRMDNTGLHRLYCAVAAVKLIKSYQHFILCIYLSFR